MAASFLPFAQQILGGFLQSFLDNGSSSSSSDSGSNLASSSSSSSSSPIGGSSSAQVPLPSDLLGWAAFLFSFADLRNWVKLFVLGTVLETLRRYASWLYNRTTHSMFATVHFTEYDSSYNWIMIWLAKQPSWRHSRNIQISTVDYGDHGTVIPLDGSEDTEPVRGSRKMSFVPSLDCTYHVWYKRHLITITKTQSKPMGAFDNAENILTLSIFDPFRSTVLKDLLQEARRSYVVTKTRFMRIWVSDSDNNWSNVASREKRDLSSIILDPGVKKLMVDDANDFLENEDWYRSRGIPFRRGYLLHGTPGSGKTSLIHGIAGELGLDVYVITLSRSGLDDSGLQELLNTLPPQCIAVIEDIDAAFTHGINRDTAPNSVGGDDVDDGPTIPSARAPSRLTLSGLLNSLDGIGSQEGRILFATTNKYSALDPALCRPGRMDLHIEFKNASKYQARRLFERFYTSPKVQENKSATSSEGEDSPTLSNIDEKCPEEDIALDRDSGYGSPSPPDGGIKGYRHIIHGPSLLDAQVTGLAETFAGYIPERGCSMASLQGYLMMHKSQPIRAVEQVEAWIEKEQNEKGLQATSPSSVNETGDGAPQTLNHEQHERIPFEPYMGGW